MRRSALVFVFVGCLAGVPAMAAGQAAATAEGETAGYYFMLGRYLEHEGRLEEAVAALRRASELAPDAAEPYSELAGLYARQNRAVEAVDAARAGLKRDPENAEANRVLGTVYGALSEQGQPLRPGEDPEEYPRIAITALEKSRLGGASDPNIELMLGRLYIRAGDPERAIEPLRRVVEDYPGYPEAALLLADSYAAAGQLPEATEALEEAIDQNPGFLRGRVRLAELYEQQRRFQDAAAAYAGARALNPRLDLTAAQATALINAGRAADARDLLQAAMKGRPRADAAQMYLLGQAQRRLGDAAAAAATAARLKEEHPGDLRAAYLEAQLASDAGRYPAALAAYEQILAAVPDDPTFVYGYAHVLDKAGRPADAERTLRGVLARNPDDAMALNALGYMFAERGERLDEAVDLLTRALALEPDNPSFLDSLGWAYFRQGRYDLADEPLTKAAEGLPDTSVVHAHLGDLRFQQKRFPEAVAAWERALAGDGEDIDRAAIEKKLQDARRRVGKNGR